VATEACRFDGCRKPVVESVEIGVRGLEDRVRVSVCGEHYELLTAQSRRPGAFSFRTAEES
jgi:hypothetical protein